ncbi:MAG: hypothetical protein ACK4QP_06910 [Pseudorhizobium sp.]|jgi:hypothetical protein
MAKGQMRSNRETRKPKKDKVAPTAPVKPGLQVRVLSSESDKKGK